MKEDTKIMFQWILNGQTEKNWTGILVLLPDKRADDG